MATVNEAAIKILVDGKEYEETLDDFNKRLGHAGARGQEAGGSIKRGFTLARAGILAAAAAVTGVVAGLNKAVTVASDYAEANQRMLVVFKGVATNARLARDDVAKYANMSLRAATEMVGHTGAIVKGMGLQEKAALDLSVATIKFAGDLASAANIEGGAEQVARALTSAYTGEREALKSVGIVITEAEVKSALLAKGQKDLEGAALQAARAQATLELAMTKQADAIGDTERSAGTYAHTQRAVAAATEDLALKLGAVFLPIWNKVLQAVLKFVDWLGEQNIGGMLNQTWTVIEEFATRVWAIISNLFIALDNLVRGNMAAAGEALSNLWSAIAEGWDETIANMENSYEEGNRAYEEFLAGDVEATVNAQNAMVDNAVAQINKVVETNKVATEAIKINHIRSMHAMQPIVTETSDKAEKDLKRGFVTPLKLSITTMDDAYRAFKNMLIKMSTELAAREGLLNFLGPLVGWSAGPIAGLAGTLIGGVASIFGWQKGGEITRPTIGLLGEKGPEIVAPKKDFIDVVRSGELSGGISAQLSDKMDQLIDVFSNMSFRAELEDDALAIKVEKGSRNLAVRTF